MYKNSYTKNPHIAKLEFTHGKFVVFHRTRNAFDFDQIDRGINGYWNEHLPLGNLTGAALCVHERRSDLRSTCDEIVKARLNHGIDLFLVFQGRTQELNADDSLVVG